jgi:hypothetical protein
VEWEKFADARRNRSGASAAPNCAISSEGENMSHRIQHGIITSLLIAASGCGGHGYGGGSYMPPPAAPTVTFSQPAQATTIKFGQGLTVAWTSTNATTCTASTSGANAGSFSGGQSASGSVTVAPMAAGSYTYSLMCTGAGGSMTGTTATVTVDPSILSTLAASHAVTIGSTVDPTNGDFNPYGLALAPASDGLMTQGDLIACNFNDVGGTQGNGTTIVGLHPTPGSQPYRIAQSTHLQGCNAITLLADDSISAAAWTVSANPLVTAMGMVNLPFTNSALTFPWGEAYAPANGSNPAAIYVSNAVGGTSYTAGGTVVRISLNGDAASSITEIAKGFCTSGSPGAIYGPSGLTYDASIDTLYVIDTASDSVIAIANVSSVGADGVVADGQCSAVMPPAVTAALTFSGASSSSARVIAHGTPLDAPLSATLLSDGDLLIGNADVRASGPGPGVNLMIEVSPVLPGGFVGAPFQADNGAPGALFGIAATTDSTGHQILYFNDDNANTVMQLGP